jgi:hypothetical protein
MNNPNAVNNLIPFKKGKDERRCPGKPKGALSLSAILKNLAKKRIISIDEIEGKSRRMTVAEKMMLVLIAKAISGDIPALKEINERIDGKVSQPMQIGNLDGTNFEPIAVTEVFVDSLEEAKEILKDKDAKDTERILPESIPSASPEEGPIQNS